MTTMTDQVRAGDWIEVDSPGDAPRRRGLVLEVIGEEHHRRFRVRWDEEHESLYYPADGMHVLPRRAARRRPPRTLI